MALEVRNDKFVLIEDQGVILFKAWSICSCRCSDRMLLDANCEIAVSITSLSRLARELRVSLSLSRPAEDYAAARASNATKVEEGRQRQVTTLNQCLAPEACTHHSNQSRIATFKQPEDSPATAR